MRNKKLIVTGFILTLLVWSCEYNVEDENPIVGQCEEEVAYSNTIRPLIDAKCMPCHNGDGSEPFAPDLTTYNGVASIATLVKEVTETGRMPKNGTLTDQEIEDIGCWVDAGAPEN